MENIYQFNVKNNAGKEVSLETYRGKVLLIVNTASRCGFTNQYEGLQELYLNYREQGLVVLGFPCNQFGGQEPGSDQEIQEFCSLNFSVNFPLFKKLDVNGKNADPLFTHLKQAAPGILGSKKIKWNFTKFLVDKEGRVVKRFAPNAKPIDITKEVADHL
ncbi:MAG: glutathione peroxidase [Halobacteriovoraceae bacterium]|jgi:glutathione peroxidase|nr:glutathione peroxidase [Halobacteriovoraceae bacterium]MBT5093666.1 glutathione peroxidase [Halobacteriovoraceae bacterium]